MRNAIYIYIYKVEWDKSLAGEINENLKDGDGNRDNQSM